MNNTSNKDRPRDRRIRVNLSFSTFLALSSLSASWSRISWSLSCDFCIFFTCTSWTSQHHNPQSEWKSLVWRHSFYWLYFRTISTIRATDCHYQMYLDWQNGNYTGHCLWNTICITITKLYYKYKAITFRRWAFVGFLTTDSFCIWLTDSNDLFSTSTLNSATASGKVVSF